MSQHKLWEQNIQQTDPPVKTTLIYKQISSNSFKNESTDKLFTYKSYVYQWELIKKKINKYKEVTFFLKPSNRIRNLHMPER